jgi:hypothetical protein
MVSLEVSLYLSRVVKHLGYIAMLSWSDVRSSQSSGKTGSTKQENYQCVQSDNILSTSMLWSMRY